MNLKLLFFARLRETLGVARESLNLEAPATVADLLEHLRTRGGAWSTELAPGRNFRIAVNQEMANLGTPLADGDEVAVFPPVTGG